MNHQGRFRIRRRRAKGNAAADGGGCDDKKENRRKGTATCPFSIAVVLAVVEQRKSRLNSVRHGDGSSTATCIFYAVRV
jgi:hypothetical protein